MCLFYGYKIAILLLYLQQTLAWNANFVPASVEIHMDESVNITLDITSVDLTLNNYSFVLKSKQAELAQSHNVIHLAEVNVRNASWHGNVSVEGIFLGKTQITVQLLSDEGKLISESGNLQVIVSRKQRVIDHVFTGSVILLVSLLYINFGAALDLTVLRNIVVRPIGPAIAFVLQFIGMPLLSYVLGLLIFPDSVEMQLGLFFTGVSPSGGASNIWTAILNGNINLSLLMTAISNFAAFGMMPFWLFTLGSFIFARGNLQVPYSRIASYAVGLVVPIAIGLAIQRCLPRVARILVRLLKPISSLLIVFIVIFAIVTNLYLFKLFSWQIIVAGLALPWLAYVMAWLLAKLFRQNPADALTIAIETGIQNTGIAIFLLRLGLPQPEADLTTVIPVAVSIMTPFPLLALYIYKRFTTPAEPKNETQIGEHERIPEADADLN